MTKTQLQILALQNAAKKQPDPVKRGKILAKIMEIESKIKWNKFLGQ